MTWRCAGCVFPIIKWQEMLALGPCFFGAWAVFFWLKALASPLQISVEGSASQALRHVHFALLLLPLCCSCSCSCSPGHGWAGSLSGLRWKGGLGGAEGRVQKRLQQRLLAAGKRLQ